MFPIFDFRSASSPSDFCLQICRIRTLTVLVSDFWIQICRFKTLAVLLVLDFWLQIYRFTTLTVLVLDFWLQICRATEVRTKKKLTFYYEDHAIQDGSGSQLHLFKRYLKITFDADKYNAILTMSHDKKATKWLYYKKLIQI